MFYTPRMRAAIDFAADAHEGQRRKATDLPYIIHPLAVAMIVARCLDDEDTIIAAILHDTIEDASVSKARIADEFGDRVARIVDEVSEVKMDEAGNKLPWKLRKRAQLAEMHMLSSEAWAVKTADAIANLADMRAQHLREGDSMFKRFGGGKDGQIWWYDCLVEILCRDTTSLSGELCDQWHEFKTLVLHI